MAPRPTKKSPGSTTPQPPPRPDLPVQARHPPPPGLPATAPRPTAVVGRVAELMGGKFAGKLLKRELFDIADSMSEALRALRSGGTGEAACPIADARNAALAAAGRIGAEAGPMSATASAPDGADDRTVTILTCAAR